MGIQANYHIGTQFQRWTQIPKRDSGLQRQSSFLTAERSPLPQIQTLYQRGVLHSRVKEAIAEQYISRGDSHILRGHCEWGYCV